MVFPWFSSAFPMVFLPKCPIGNEVSGDAGEATCRWRGPSPKLVTWPEEMGNVYRNIIEVFFD